MNGKYKYQKIKAKVIEDAQSSNSYRLPSERELCKRYKVSRCTAQNVMKALHDEGLVTREVGRGTFIIPSKRKLQLSFIQLGMGKNMSRFIEQELTAYSDGNPNIDVKLHVIKPDEAIRSVRQLPGAKIIFAPFMGYLIELGLLAPLDKTASFKDSIRCLNNQFIDWVKLDNQPAHCYALPFFTTVSACAINKQVAKSLKIDKNSTPACFDELFQWLEKADQYNKAASKPVMGTHLFDYESQGKQMPSIPFYLALSQGQQFLENKSGKVSFDFKHGEKWLKTFQKICRNSSIFKQTTPYPHPILSNKTLFNYDIGPWILKELDNPSDFIICPYPAAKPGGATFTYANKLSLAVIEDGQENHPGRKAAWDLVLHLSCQEEVQQRMSDQLSFISPLQSVFSEQVKDPSLQPFIKQLATAVMPLDHPIQHSIMKLIRQYAFQSIYDKIPITEAVSRIHDMGQLLLELESERFPEIMVNN